MRKLLFILLAQLFGVGLLGAPAKSTPIIHIQSDGSEITIIQRGDEFFNWRETLDGYTLLRNENRDFVYAKLDSSGDLISSELLARNPDQRTLEETDFLEKLGQHIYSRSNNLKKSIEAREIRSLERKTAAKNSRTTGVRQQMVVLVEYADVAFRTSYSGVASGTPLVEVFHNIMNAPNYTVNGAIGSVKQYFLDNSNGKLSLESTVLAPVKLSRPRNYYSVNNTRIREMFMEALNLLNARGEDFTRFTNNGNTVEHLHFIFAGPGWEQSDCDECIWSHNWSIANTPQLIGGVFFRFYSCSPELDEASTSPTNIGVICHEIGHTLGLSDMYDTDETGSGGRAKGLGPWSLMANGLWNNDGKIPPYLNAFERYQLGWFKPILVTEFKRITLPPMGDSAVSYVFYAKNTDGTPRVNERFYIENRNVSGTGVWDAGIRQGNPQAVTTGGLMVYHMDSASPNPTDAWINNKINVNPNRENFRIISAAGTSSNFNSDPFPRSGVDSLTDNSRPTTRFNTRSWANTPSEMPIRNITRNPTTNVVTFTIGIPPDCPDSIVTNLSKTIYEGDSIFFKNTYLKTPGLYIDTLSNEIGCDSIVKLQLTVASSIVPILLSDTETKIIPNPVKINEEFTVILPAYFSNSTINIYTISGELILSKPVHDEEIRIPGLGKPGTYILQVIGKEFQIKSTKIIVAP